MSNNQQISFQGRVIDQDKQAPLRGIKVSLDFSGAPPVVYTDLEGIYKFKVNFRDSSTIKGQLTIEAKGYNTHNSRIELSPKHKDLGDIQIGTTHLTTSTTTNSSTSINTTSNSNDSTSSINASSPGNSTSSIKNSSPSNSTSIKNSSPSSNSNTKSNTNSKNNNVDGNNVLMPLMVATMIAFGLIIAALTQPSTQETPLKTREKRINPYHQNHTRILNDP